MTHTTKIRPRGQAIERIDAASSLDRINKIGLAQRGRRTVINMQINRILRAPVDPCHSLVVFGTRSRGTDAGGRRDA